MKQLFIAWIAFQRRPISMQPYFGYQLKFLSLAFHSRYLRPLEYFFKSVITLWLLLCEQPQVVWVQLAPTPPLYLAYLYKVLFNSQVAIIADCHNVMFRYPWISFPGAIALLNRCDVVLVHNDYVKEQVKAAGVNPKTLLVLEDRPSIVNYNIVANLDRFVFLHPWVLFPCSFNADEPIEAVLAAARLIPKITFVLTGNITRAKGIHNLKNIPPNVKLPGYLPTVEFDILLLSTDAVLGLTVLDGVQLCSANEAVGTGKPLILSQTRLLQKMFYKGAIYVNPLNPQSIAQGCQEAISRKEELSQQINELKAERHNQWLEQARAVDAILNS
ncbi:MAG TPA: hypothetical protein V6D28_10535 [Leptolyngbyaceae cyanobacterium]